jgi:hypothetical protein
MGSYYLFRANGLWPGCCLYGINANIVLLLPAQC